MKRLITIFGVAVLGVLVASWGEQVRAGISFPTFVTDHFRCYKVKGDNVKLKATLDDQFLTGSDVKVGNPKFLCNPTDKTTKEAGSATIQNQNEHLVCYNIKPREEPDLEVIVQNQFGNQTLRVGESRFLCVPSLKTILD